MQVSYINGKSVNKKAHIAQLVEHFHGKEKVACSIQAVGTINLFNKFFTKNRQY